MNKDAKRLRVDLQAIKKFDADLGAQLENNPAEFLPLVRPSAIDDAVSMPSQVCISICNILIT